jgi:hypothetical protein
MKRDWSKPGMRLSVEGYSNDSFAFLLFLRLALVTGLCLAGPLLVSKACGPCVGAIAYIGAFPFWWWHFGLPRFKEPRSGFFAPGFCLFGYLAMSVSLAVIALMAFGVIKEGQPHPLPQWFPRSHFIGSSLFLRSFPLSHSSNGR